MAEGKKFIDTNIVIYSNDARDERKQRLAIAVMESAFSSSGAISTQVLQEYANTALAKLGQNPQAILRQLRLLSRLEVVSISTDLVCRAVEIRQVYSISFWDACIVAAAETAGCQEIVSEDLNQNQYYAGLKVTNPFA